MTKKIKLAIETTIVDKIPSKSPLWKTATTGFRNVELTAQELADHINLGHPLCAQHQGGRSQANFLCSDIVAVDIDDGMRLDEALAHPYVQQHAAILYTTPSHTDENHRFRIIFALPRTIADAAEMRSAYTGLIYKFGGDESCKDACRLFFGSKGSDPIVLGNVMTPEALDELLLLGQETRASDSHGDRSADRSQNHVTTRRSGRTLELDQEVTMRNGKTLPLSMMYVGAAIHCPVHIDRNPSAFVVENRHGIKGVHCMACAASFWPPSAFPALKKIDFYRVEGIVREQEYEEDPAQHYDEDDAPPGLMEQAQAERRFFTFSRQYLSDLDDAMFDGVTFLRSPKGTGKTEQLKKVVDWCKKNGLSVLLAGHRQTLLDSMADRLGMTCYMSGRQRNNEPDAHYAICLDSIGKLLKPDMHKYDVVLLDEAEQVINHLTGDTMRGKRRACMLKLFHYMQVAKSVIVSDADLGDITIEAICQIMNSNTQYRFFMNTYKESRCPFYLYENDKHLITNMVQTIKTGGRHYVATNSKKKAEMLAELIRKECGDDRQVLLVTSDTTKSQEVSKLLHHIKTEILNYDVVIASPTMGTGIDITFDDKAQLIDTVFGLFEARINTHFDIDQQLSRVRHPKEIKVWVSPQPFSFETDPCVIRRELIENGELSDALQRIKPDGTPELDETYLSIYATVTSISRASKNRLKKNLAELRTRNGWNITLVELDDDAMEQGKDKAAQAKGIVEARRIAALCSAKQIESERYQELKEKGRRYQYLSQDEDLSMRRHEIEAFYRTDISPELVELDDHGAYRDKVRLMQTRMLSFETAKEQAIKERDAEKLASDREHPILKKKMLHELLSAAGVEDAYGTILTDVDLSNDTLGEFSKICKNKASMMQELFGICVRKDVEKKPIRQLGDILDLVGLQTTQPIRRKAQGKTTYIYKIDGDSLNLITEIIERRVSNPNQAVPHWKPLTAAQEAHARKKEEEEEEADRKKNAIFG